MYVVAKTFGEGKDLSVGYKYSLGGTDYNYPLIVSYETKNSISGVISEHVIELPIYNENGKYDIIGHSTGSNKLIRTVDINTIENEVIDPESFVFYNIYPIIRSDLSQAGSEFIPDVSESYKAAAKKSFTDYIDVLDIINFKFVSISSFAGYTCLIMNVDEVPTAFETCNPKYYQNYKDRIDSGELEAFLYSFLLLFLCHSGHSKHGGHAAQKHLFHFDFLVIKNDMY